MYITFETSHFRKRGNENEKILCSILSLWHRRFLCFIERKCLRILCIQHKGRKDLWVEENKFNGRHYVASAVTRRIVEQVMGRYFKVVTNLYGDGLNVVLRKNEGEY